MNIAVTEVDGRSVLPGRDPPGQRSTYIPPGDTEKETYRLVTFTKFPEHIPVDPILLAANGFYYTGYKDRTKCFSCGACVEDWTNRDDPSSFRWHEQDCEMVTGWSRNIPISNFRNSHRPTATSQPPPPSTSSSSNQHESHSEQYGSGIPAGMLLMEGERTRSGSFQTARVVSQSTPHPPSSPRHIPPASSNPPPPMSAPRQEPEDEGAFARMQLFPCRDPANSQMQEEEDRMRTFTSNFDRWASQNILASPRDFVKAGLYYLGMGDRVKCWYCNGGLQNWRRDDDPWTEHAKWFPTCEFLLQRKGLEYVERVVARFPDLNRPTPVARTRDLPAALSQYTIQPGRAIEIIDPRAEQRKRKEKVDQLMNSSEFIREASAMGFGERDIRASLLRNLEEDRCKIENLEQLVEDILAHPNNEDEEEMEEEQVPSPSSSASSSSSSSSVEECVEELRRLEKERTCKKCRKEKASVVLLPCGHLVCCRACGENIVTCPACKGHVQETVRSFIA